MTVLLLLILLADGKVFRPVASNEARWTESASWSQSDQLPTAKDRVLIPGRSRQTRQVTIAAGSQGTAASIMVGATLSGEGSMAIEGSLQVEATAAQDRQAGRMYVGRQTGEGVVMQMPGSDVRIGTSLRLGFDAGGRGQYFVQEANLQVARDIQIATDPTTEGLLDLDGRTSVSSRTLRMGSGKARLQFTSSEDDIPTVSVSRLCQMRGSLRVDLRSLSTKPEVIPLIRSGSTDGGFRRVRVFTKPNDHYELSYSGGDGNDVVLRRLSKPWDSFEEWRTHQFGAEASAATSGAFADPDGDQVPNMGEYKLGCCPHTHEGDPVRVQTNTRGEVSIRYVERIDRRDVQVVPQASRDGRVWLSDLVTTRVVQTTGDTRVVRATATEPNLKFRLAFELIPESGVRPNVLFVIIDDLNDWTEGLGGHPQALTPNLNRIAARGMRFRNAYTPAGLCGPARVALLTGRHPISTGIYNNSARMRNSPVLKNAVTIPENFKAGGYHISGGGKLFHYTPHVDWHDYFPSLTENRIRDPLPENRPLNGIENPRTRWFDWGPVDVEDDEMGDTQVATWVSEQLRASRQQPFLMTCGFFRPHVPMFVPPKYFAPFAGTVSPPPGVFENDADDLPQAALDWVEKQSGSDHRAILEQGEWENAVRSYLACVYFADAQLGRVLDALEEGPSLRNTVVIVTSDHGWLLGEKNHWRKFSMWEPSCRVPLIIAAPGITTPGSECRESISLLDLYPTFNELCELEKIPSLEGQSLLPQLRNPLHARTQPVLTTRYYNHTVRDRRWRYTRYETGEEELYDHEADQFERHNLAGRSEYQSIMDRLRQWIPDEQHEPIPGGE